MHDNYLFILRRDKPFMINITGGMILIFAFLRILNSPLSGVIMIIASVGLFSYQTGIEINFKEKLYRNVTVFGPILTGKWVMLPEFEYVSLFKTSLTHTSTGRSGVSISRKSSIVQVSLVTDQKKRIRVFEGMEMDEAIRKAKDFSEKLSLGIWDATVRPADWYSEDTH